MSWHCVGENERSEWVLLTSGGSIASFLYVNHVAFDSVLSSGETTHQSYGASQRASLKGWNKSDGTSQFMAIRCRCLFHSRASSFTHVWCEQQHSMIRSSVSSVDWCATYFRLKLNSSGLLVKTLRIQKYFLCLMPKSDHSGTAAVP